MICPSWTFDIRSYRTEDIPLLFAAVRESINEISCWQPWCHPGYSLKDSTDWIMSRYQAQIEDREHSFVIVAVDAKTEVFVGGIGLNQINRLHQIANLGYWVRSSWTRRGAATTATRLIAHYGFTQLGLQRLEIVAAVGNNPSQRVAEKANAKKEGILRKRLRIHGVVHSAVLYSLIAEDLYN